MNRPTSMQIGPTVFSGCPFAPGDAIWAYVRMSTGDQNIDSQLRAVQDWCQMHGVLLTRTFADEARSGTTTAGREAFMEMVELMRNPHLIANPKPIGIVFWSLARFARDFDDSQFFKSDLRRRGYVLHSMTDAIPDGPIGRVVESIHDFNNEQFVHKMKIEVRRGLYDIAAQGYAIGGFPPRGYRRSAPISLGRKKNGEERIAYKWEIDEHLEERVRRAWQMRLEGHGHWEIHKETKIFKSIGCYATFFTNIGYAGVGKCGTARFPNAHPAYVTQEEFDKVQAMRRTLPGNKKAPNGDPQHSRRQRSRDPLSGLVYCTCGGLMVISTKSGQESYRCGRQQRQGRDACEMPRIVAWYIRDLLYQWMTENVLTFDCLARARDAVNQILSGDQSQLLERQALLEDERARIDRAAKNLYDTVEVAGLTDELRRRLRERTLEMRETETELARIGQMLRQERLDVGDDVLARMAAGMSERLKNGNPDEVRAIVRQTIVRTELDRNLLRVRYLPPLVQLQLIGGINAVPPRISSLNTSLAIQPLDAEISFAGPPTGRASPVYRRGP